MADTDAPSQETHATADKQLPEDGNDCQELDTGCRVESPWHDSSPDLQEGELGSDAVAIDRPELYNNVFKGTGLASPIDQSRFTPTQVSPEEAATAGWRREPLAPEDLHAGEVGSWRPLMIAQEPRPESTTRKESMESSASLSLSLSSSSSHQENELTLGIGSYHSNTSYSLTRSQQQAIGYHTPSTSVTTAQDLSSTEHRGEGGVRQREAYEPIADSANEPDGERTCGSPFLLVKESDVTDVSQFESPGLLYARSNKAKHERDMFHPADEVAEDVLEAFKGSVHEEAVTLKPMVLKKGGERGEGETSWRREVEVEGKEGLRTRREQKPPDQLAVGLEQDAVSPRKYSRQPPPIDPGVLLHLESDAQKLAGSLAYTMDNLRNSLHAMTVCSQQSIQLHRETMENLHRTVDANVKAMYTFMAKFEELNNNIGPMLEIAAQIRELNETLRTLERQFRVP